MKTIFFVSRARIQFENFLTNKIRGFSQGAT